MLSLSLSPSLSHNFFSVFLSVCLSVSLSVCLIFILFFRILIFLGVAGVFFLRGFILFLSVKDVIVAACAVTVVLGQALKHSISD